MSQVYWLCPVTALPGRTFIKVLLATACKFYWDLQGTRSRSGRLSDPPQGRYPMPHRISWLLEGPEVFSNVVHGHTRPTVFLSHVPTSHACISLSTHPVSCPSVHLSSQRRTNELYRQVHRERAKHWPGSSPWLPLLLSCSWQAVSKSAHLWGERPLPTLAGCSGLAAGCAPSLERNQASDWR